MATPQLHRELEQLRAASNVTSSPVVRREAKLMEEAEASVVTQLMEALQQLQQEQDTLEAEAARVTAELAEQKRLNRVQEAQLATAAEQGQPSSGAALESDLAHIARKCDELNDLNQRLVAEHNEQTDALQAEVAALKAAAADPPDPRQSQAWQEGAATHAAETDSLRAQIATLEAVIAQPATALGPEPSPREQELEQELVQTRLEVERLQTTAAAAVESASVVQPQPQSHSIQRQETSEDEDFEDASELEDGREGAGHVSREAVALAEEQGERLRSLMAQYSQVVRTLEEEQSARSAVEDTLDMERRAAAVKLKRAEDAAEAQVKDVAKAHAVVVELERRLGVVDAEKIAATEKTEAIETQAAAAESKARSRIEELERQLEEAKLSTADAEASSDAGSFYSADEAALNLSNERTEAELEEQRALAEVLSAQLADAVEKQTEMAAVAASLERAVQEEKDRALVAIKQLEGAVQDEKDKNVMAMNEHKAASSRADLLEDQLSVLRAEAAMQKGQYERAVASANKAADDAAAQLHGAQKALREAENKAVRMAFTLGGKAELEVRCAQLSDQVKQLQAEVAAARAAALQVDEPQPRTVVQSETPPAEAVIHRAVQHESMHSVVEQVASRPQDVSTAAPSNPQVAGDTQDSGLQDEMQHRILQKEEILQKEQQIREQDGKQKAILAQVAVLLQEQEELKRQLAEASKSLVDERTAGADMTVALDTAYRRVSELEAELKEQKSASAAKDATDVDPESTGAGDDAGMRPDRERVVELEGELRMANQAAKQVQERLLQSEGAESAAEELLRQRDEQLAQLQLERATAAAEAAMSGSPSSRLVGGAAADRLSPPSTPASLAQADALALRVGELEQQLQASDAMYEELQAETISKEQELSNMGNKLRELRKQIRSQPSSPPRGPTLAELESEREEREREAVQKAEVVEALQLASAELKEAQAELETLRDAKETWESKAAAAEKKLSTAVRQRRLRLSGAEGDDAAALEEAESEIQRLKGCIEELVAQLGVLEAASRKARAADRDTIEELEEQLSQATEHARSEHARSGGGGALEPSYPQRQDRDELSSWADNQPVQYQTPDPMVLAPALHRDRYGAIPSPTLPGVRFDPPTQVSASGMGRERFGSPYQAHYSTGLVATPQRSRNPRVAWGADGYGQVAEARNLGGEGDWNWSYPAGQASNNNRGRAWQEVFSGFHAATDRC